MRPRVYVDCDNAVGRGWAVDVCGGGCDGWLRGQTFSGEWWLLRASLVSRQETDVRDWKCCKPVGIGWCVVVFAGRVVLGTGSRRWNCPDGLGFLFLPWAPLV